jgi:hypothetical protein
MPRDFDQQIQQGLQGNHRTLFLVRINLDTPIFMHSRFGEYEFEGNTYYGVGALGGISAKVEDPVLDPQRLTLSLTGIDLRFYQEMKAQNYQNRDVWIWKALLNDDDTIMGNVAIRWFRGLSGDGEVMEEAGGTCGVTLTVANFLAKWKRSANLRYNDKTQQELFAGDTFLQYVIEAQRGKVWRGT